MDQMKEYNKISLNYTFVAQFDQIDPLPYEEMFTFRLNIGENSMAEVYLNSTLIIKTDL
jgi:hypothetical protein